MLASATRHRLALLTASLCAVLVLAACRAGVPVIDPNPGPPAVNGTITGTISTEDGKSGIQGRPENTAWKSSSPRAKSS
jgi:hypothetical protein